MGFQQRMMNMMMGKKSPEDMAQMMPQMMEKMGHEGMEHMMLKMMPQMMDTCFAEMDQERRQFILSHCRGMLDRIEAKYPGAAAT